VSFLFRNSPRFEPHQPNQWARTNPPPKQSGYHNPGYPGCCRPPAPNEMRFIQAAEWPAVSIIHGIPIPPEIKNILDSLAHKSHFPPFVAGPIKSLPNQIPPSSIDRRNSGSASPSSKHTPLAKSVPVSIPSKARQGGGSPQLAPGSLTSGAPCRGNTALSSDSSDNRRQEHGDRRPDSHPSPIRKQLELDGSAPLKRPPTTRSSTSNISPSASATKLAVEPVLLPTALRRRSSTSGPNPVLPKSSAPPRSSDRQAPVISVETRISRVPIVASPASSSSGSETSLGSLTDYTADGGFTDYLSEESEEELQRQAEARAILVAQSRAEEQEFRAARQQLANVDLRPPNTWNPRTGAVNPSP
jgi:hypothetical protein